MSDYAHSPFRALTRPVTGEVQDRRIHLTRAATPDPADPYAAGDAIVQTLEFLHVGVPGRTVYVVGASVQSSKRDSVEVFRLHLYNKPPAGFADGAGVSAPRPAERDTYLGNLTFPAAAAVGASGEAYTELAKSMFPFNLYLPDGHLYGVLEGTVGETPAAGQVYVVRLLLDRN